jgi:hypothetical protein
MTPLYPGGCGVRSVILVRSILLATFILSHAGPEFKPKSVMRGKGGKNHHAE